MARLTNMTKAEWVLSHPDDVIKRLDILLEEVGRLSGEEIDPKVFWSEMFSRGSQIDRVTIKDGQIHVSREDIWPA